MFKRVLLALQEQKTCFHVLGFICLFEWVLLALQEQKTCSQVSGFICLQVFCSKKGGQNNKGNGPRRESEKG